MIRYALSRYASLPVVVAVLVALVVLVAGFAHLTPDRPEAPLSAPPSTPITLSATETETVPEIVPEEPALVEDVPAPDAPPAPVEAEVEEPLLAADGTLLVNPKSRPAVGSAPKAAPAPRPETIAAPVGVLYQRDLTVAAGVPGAPSVPAFDRVEALPSDASVVSIIHAVFPQSEWSRAERVAGCESGMRSVSSKPNRNGTVDHGVFQLNDGGTLQGLLRSLGEDPANVSLALDPEWNVRAAHVLWQQRGWQPWTCSGKLGITDGLYSPRPGPNW